MQRKSILFLLPILALLLWWMLGESPGENSSPEPSGVAPVANHPTPQEPAPRKPSAIEPAVALEQGDTEVAPLPVADQGTRAAVEAAAPVQTRAVLVQDAVTEAPVAGAIVFLFDRGAYDQDALREEMGDERDFDKLLERFSQRYETGKDGKAFVPRTSGKAIVVARHGDRQAMTQDAGQEDVTLRLESSSAIDVRVVDEQGQPKAGVRVALQAKLSMSNNTLLQKTTEGDEGRARIDHIETFLQQIPDAKLKGEFQVAIDQPLVQAEAVVVDLQNLPQETVELVLPPTGTVVVRWAAEEAWGGAPPKLVELALGRETEFGRPEAQRPVQDGRAVFEHVGLGEELVARADLGDARRFRVEAKGQGPTTAGEVVEILLAPEAEPTVLTGRLLRADGEPLSKERVTLCYWIQEGGGGGAHRPEPQVKTQEDGSFELLPEAEFIAQLGYSLKSRTLEVVWVPKGAGAPQSAKVELPVDPGPGRTDLGDIRLSDQPIVVAGVVVDSSGKPPRFGHVSVEWRPLGGGADGQHWRRAFLCDAFLERDGSFRVTEFGELGQALSQAIETRLEVDSDSRTAPVPFVVGQTDLRIVLEVGTTLSGRVLLDEGLDEESIRIELKMSGPTESGAFGQAISSEFSGNMTIGTNLNRGAFQYRDLSPGTAQLSVLGDFDSEPVFVAEGIRIERGENRDPRLEAIDLRGRLRSFSIKLLAPDGKPAAQPTVRALGATHFSNRLQKGNETLITTAAPAVDLLCLAQGCGATILRGVRESQVVTLPAPLPVEVRLTSPIDVPPGCTTTIHLSGPFGQHDEADDSFLGLALELDSSGTYRGAVPLEGTWRASLSLRRDGNEWQGIEVDPSQLEIGPSGGDFAVEVNRAAFLKSVESFK